MTATERQAFFDTLRRIDRRVDELRDCLKGALAAGNLGAMDRRYIIGKGENAMVLKISVEPVVATGPTLADPDTGKGKSKKAMSPMNDVADALEGLVQAVTTEVNEKGGGGYLLARLSDARDALRRCAERIARRKRK